MVDRLPGFTRRMQWFIDNRPEFREHVETLEHPAGGRRRLLSIVSRDQLPRVLRYLLDEAEFLSPYGIRAVSQYHRTHPYILLVNGTAHRVDYEPAESSTGLFGGNSNWRGPVWFPVNYLLIESLQKFHHFYGDSLKIPFPDWCRRDVEPLGRGGGAVPPAHPHLLTRRQRPPAGLRRHGEVPAGSALA